MSGSGSHRVCVPDHVSLTDAERRVLVLVLFVYFLYVKISWLIISPRPQILITVGGCLRGYDLIWVVHRGVQVLLFLLLLDGSLQHQDVVGGSSWQLMERGALIVLEVVVWGAWDSGVRHKILFYRTLSRWLKTGRFMIMRWRRLRHLISGRPRWRAIVQYRAHPSIRCVESRYKPFLKVLLIEYILYTFKFKLKYYRVLLVCPWPRFRDLVSGHIKDTFDLSLMLANYILMISMLSMLIKLAFWLVGTWTDFRGGRALGLVMAKHRALKSVLGRIEKLEPWLLQFQV